MTRLAISITLLGMLVVGGVKIVPAQEARGEEKLEAPTARYRPRRGEALARWLGLSEAQQAQIRKIVRRSREQARQIREDASLTPAQKRERRHALRRATRQQIGAVLTPEQREKMRRLWAWRWRQWPRWQAWKDVSPPRPPFGSRQREREEVHQGRLR